MEILLLIIPVIGGVAFLIFIQYGRQREKIEAKVEGISGRLIQAERKLWLLGSDSPFKIVMKGQTVYKITYELNGETKVGWVKFGSLQGNDWRL